MGIDVSAVVACDKCGDTCQVESVRLTNDRGFTPTGGLIPDARKLAKREGWKRVLRFGKPSPRRDYSVHIDLCPECAKDR